MIRMQMDILFASLPCSGRDLEAQTTTDEVGIAAADAKSKTAIFFKFLLQHVFLVLLVRVPNQPDAQDSKDYSSLHEVGLLCVVGRGGGKFSSCASYSAFDGVGVATVAGPPAAGGRRHRPLGAADPSPLSHLDSSREHN